MIYHVGNHSFSHNLSRYAVEMGREDNYSIGFCTLEYIAEDYGIFRSESKMIDIDTDKPYDIIRFDSESDIQGRLAVQLRADRYNVSRQEALDWIADRVPAEQETLEQMIDISTSTTNQQISEIVKDRVKERLLIRHNKPSKPCSRLVGALLRNTGTIKARQYYNMRTGALADGMKITPRQMELLMCCHHGNLFWRSQVDVGGLESSELFQTDIVGRGIFTAEQVELDELVSLGWMRNDMNDDLRKLVLKNTKNIKGNANAKLLAQASESKDNPFEAYFLSQKATSIIKDNYL